LFLLEEPAEQEHEEQEDKEAGAAALHVACAGGEGDDKRRLHATSIAF
jgi:hypothetical protein